MLSDVYFPRVNGVSTSIRAACQWLSRQGHRVTLVAPDYGDAAQRQSDGEFGDGFELLRLPARKIFFDPEDRLIRGDALRAVLPRLKAGRWDVIHVHTPFRAHRLGVQLARATSTPVVETYHTYFEEYVAHYLPWAPAPLLRRFARGASRHLCDAVDQMIVPSEAIAHVLRAYGVRTPATVIPSGIALEEFASGNGAAFRERHGIDPQRTLIATVSRLALEKNIDFLLWVAHRLVPEFPDLLFLIAGEGPDAQRLKAMTQSLGLEGSVRFFGNLDRRQELPDCYRAADVFVFASPTETQGLVLIEAMASGTPIVSTAVMGTAAVLRDAKSALVSPPDVGEFAAHVSTLLRDPERRGALGAAGRHDALAWSSDRWMRETLALYSAMRRRDAADVPPVPA